MLKVMGHVMHVEFGRCDIYLIWVHTLWAFDVTYDQMCIKEKKCNYCDGKQRRECSSLFISDK